MQEAFLEVGGVRTNVLTYGRWVEEAPKSGPEDLILLFPGNPGITGFYRLFMQTLHEQTGFPVWAVAYAGHELPKNDAIEPIQRWTGNEHLFGLKGQVQHKIDFVQRYVPKEARLHLVGHSIGGFMALEVLHNEEISAHVASVNLLFPTIERMAETRSGIFINQFVRRIIRFVLFLACLITVLPNFISDSILVMYMKLTGIPKMHFKPIAGLVNPKVLKKVFSLAFEEMDMVKVRDSDIIGKNVDKIRIMYGQNDGWFKKSIYDDIKRDFPTIKAEITKYDHCFIFKESRQIALVVADWVK